MADADCRRVGSRQLGLFGPISEAPLCALLRCWSRERPCNQAPTAFSNQEQAVRGLETVPASVCRRKPVHWEERRCGLASLLAPGARKTPGKARQKQRCLWTSEAIIDHHPPVANTHKSLEINESSGVAEFMLFPSSDCLCHQDEPITYSIRRRTVAIGWSNSRK